MLCRYKITPGSPLLTPLMSDTFFGHLCWAIAYCNGEKELSVFLDRYGKGKPAPILFSSAFPSGYLPRPVLPPPDSGRIREFALRHFPNLFEGLSVIKKWNRQRFISQERWLNLKGGYSDMKLFESFLNEELPETTFFSELEAAAANVIDRSSGCTPEEIPGSLFHRERIWYHKGNLLDLYVQFGDKKQRERVHWFLTSYLPENGFGADKSAGMGSLSIEPDTDFDPGQFSVPDADARMSLSLTAFQGMERYEACYHLMTKFGKLGGHFAFSGPAGENPRPFKKPLLMYQPGAVFFSRDRLDAESLLENVHSDPRIRHCGIPVTLEVKIEK